MKRSDSALLIMGALLFLKCIQDNISIHWWQILLVSPICTLYDYYSVRLLAWVHELHIQFITWKFRKKADKILKK